MLDKLRAVIDVFRKGKEVSNVEVWKAGHMAGNVVGGLIIAVANVASVFGRSFPIDLASANAIGAGIVAFVNVLLIAATSKRIGILPTKPTGEDVPIVEPTVKSDPVAELTADSGLQSSDNPKSPENRVTNRGLPTYFG